MNNLVVFEVQEVDETLMNSLDWKDGEGSSLPAEIHEKMDQGTVVCLDKRPAKVKFFRKVDGQVQARCHVADRTLGSIVSGDFGASAKLQQVGALVPQPV